MAKDKKKPEAAAPAQSEGAPAQGEGAQAQGEGAQAQPQPQGALADGAPAQAGAAATEAAAPEPAKISSAPLPLTKLAAEFVGAFFELAFPDKRLVELCRELRITTPGYRLEALPPDQVARVLADEYLAAEDVRAPLETAVRESLRTPAQEGEKLAQQGLDELIDVVYQSVRGDALQQMARVAWRCLVDADPAHLQMAQVAIEDGIALLDAPPPGEKGPKKPARPEPGAKEAQEALKQAERVEKENRALKEQLSGSRADVAAREARLAEQKAELTRLQSEGARLSAEVARLTAAGEGRALTEARRSADEARSLAEKLRVATEELQSLRERLAASERKAQAAKESPQAAAPEDELPSVEEAAEFLVPVLTREFYESIERWDRRMQRAAFEKIHLLAQNWRHGSLRALQLEGVPGYYRVRIATDVRLIYRREGSQLEILSLIDREDLDRYVRQARTRAGGDRGKSEAPDAR